MNRDKRSYLRKYLSFFIMVLFLFSSLYPMMIIARSNGDIREKPLMPNPTVTIAPSPLEITPPPNATYVIKDTFTQPDGDSPNPATWVEIASKSPNQPREGSVTDIRDRELRIYLSSTQGKWVWKGVRSLSETGSDFKVDWKMKYNREKLANHQIYSALLISPYLTNGNLGVDCKDFLLVSLGGFGGGRFVVAKKVRGEVTELVNSIGEIPADDQMHDLRLVFGNDKHIKVYLDGTLRFEDILSDLTFTSGYVYLYSSSSCGAAECFYYDTRFDDIYAVSSSAIIIDQAFASREEADVNSTQTIYFHAIWRHNSSNIREGQIFVNGTGYTINSSGWIAFNVTSPSVKKQVWSVTAINMNGITSYQQTYTNPTIVWGGVRIKNMIVSAQRAIEDAERLGADLAEAKSYLSQAQECLTRGEYEKAYRLAERSSESAIKIGKEHIFFLTTSTISTMTFIGIIGGVIYYKKKKELDIPSIRSFLIGIILLIMVIASLNPMKVPNYPYGISVFFILLISLSIVWGKLKPEWKREVKKTVKIVGKVGASVGLAGIAIGSFLVSILLFLIGTLAILIGFLISLTIIGAIIGIPAMLFGCFLIFTSITGGTIGGISIMGIKDIWKKKKIPPIQEGEDKITEEDLRRLLKRQTLEDQRIFMEGKWLRTSCSRCTHLKLPPLIPMFTEHQPICMKYNKMLGGGLLPDSSQIHKVRVGDEACEGFDPVNEYCKKWALGLI